MARLRQKQIIHSMHQNVLIIWLHTYHGEIALKKANSTISAESWLGRMLA